MKTLIPLFILCAVAFSSVSHAQYILTLQCTQMDPYIGKSFQVRVVEMGSGYEVGRKTITSVTSASFSIQLYVLLSNRNYQVDFFADVNDNGAYDAPPTDHAWRRTVNNPTMNRTITFTPDPSYTDIAYPPFFPYSTYSATWGGKWMNQTFGSTDSIRASFTITCDSIFGFFATKGVFGNPATVEFDFADAISGNVNFATDTIRFSPGAPFTGDIYLINGELHADLMQLGVGLEFIGTVGRQQVLALYTVTTGGNPFANGYFYVRELEINSSTPPLELELVSLENVSCFGAADGSISVAGIGGNGFYTYQWLQTGTSLPDVTNLSPGTYDVTLTDSEGCNTDASYTITEPSPIAVGYESVNQSCSDICDGSLSLTITGGVPPYTFLWNTGSTTQDLSDLCAGNFINTVTDANGCTTEFSFVITTPDSISLNLIAITDETNGQSNGSIEVAATGGVPPFTYSLDGINFQSSGLFQGLAAGSYSILVTDSTGCTSSATYEIQNLTAVDHLIAHFKWYPNPANSLLHIETDIPLSIDILDVQGKRVRYEKEVVSGSINIQNIPPGFYIMSVSDGRQTLHEKLMVH